VCREETLGTLNSPKMASMDAKRVEVEISMLFNKLNTVKKIGFNKQCYEV
jgi:hypothetical protein